MKKERKKCSSKEAALGTQSTSGNEGKVRILATDAAWYIDVIVGAEKWLFNFFFFFFFSEVQRQIISLEGGECRKIWRFEDRGERIK